MCAPFVDAQPIADVWCRSVHRQVRLDVKTELEST